MKILQLIFSLTSGGAERFVVDLCNEMSNDNEVYLCVIVADKKSSISFYKKDIVKRVNYINLDCEKGINAKTFFTIFSLIRSIKPNIIHGHLNVLLYLYLPALFYHKNIKFFHTLHNTASKAIGFKWQRIVSKIFYSKWIHPITISEESNKSFEELFKLNNSELIANGSAKVTKTLSFAAVKNEIENYKINHDDLVFIHIARHGEAKNQRLLIDVFNKLLSKNHHLILLIIGFGFEEGEGFKLTQDNHCGINFIGTRHNVHDYLLNSDAFCLTSLWEGLPISLLEAFSCGTTPICTPAGGIPSVIKDDSLGFISKDFSFDSYYEAVLNFIKNPQKIKKSDLLNHYKQNYSMSVCANKHIDLYIKD